MTTGTRCASLPFDHRGHLQALLAEDKRRDGTIKRLRQRGRLEVHLSQRARHQLAGAVIHVDFHQQRAARRVDGVGGAHQRSLVGLVRDAPEK